MKKISVLLSVMMLSGCFSAGDYNVLPQRNDIFKVWNGYRISFYDNDAPQLMKTEKIEENNFKPNVAQTVAKGNSVLNSKVYKKDYFAEVYLKPNKNGELNSSSVPVKLRADKKYKIIGEVVVDGETYRLIPSEMPDYAVLVRKNGDFYRQIGQIDGSYLVLVDSEFFPYPTDLRMVEVKNASATQSEAVNGFDVKYDGVKLDRVWFTYLDYSQGNSNSGMFKQISFPNKPGLIKINDIGFRVLEADDNHITYMVLQ